MMRYRSVLAALMILLLLLTGAAAEDAPNLLKNGGFEQLDPDGLPSDWVFSAYRNQEGYTVFGVSDQAQEGSVAAVVNNIAYNDARFEQTVRVEPESLYCLSGWVRAENIPDSGHGANLSIAGVYAFSEGVYESGEWQYIEYYGETGEDQTELTVYVRVGGYSGESTGKAYFDDIALRKVETIPGDAVAALWFEPEQPLVQVDPVDWEEDDGVADPIWPWLLAISAAFLLATLWACPTLLRDKRDLAESRRAPACLWIGLGLSAIVRVVIALMVDGYQVDVGCFTAWGATMARVGPVQFYEATGFCDYPPAYVYVLGVKSMLASLLQGVVDASFAFKILPNICDLAAAYLLYRFARQEGVDRGAAALLGVMTAWSPAFICNSAAWCQMDSVLCLGLMLVAWLAIRRRWAWVMPVYVLCILIKPQALMLGFLGLAAIVLEWLRNAKARREMLIGVAAAVGVAAVILIPFSLNQQWDWLITLYGKTLASYPYATVNTANFYYLFDGNWSGIAQSAGRFAPACLAAMCAAWCAVLVLRMDRQRKLCWAEPVLSGAFALAFAAMAVIGTSWGVVGTAAMALAFVIVLPMYFRAGDLKALPLLGGVLFLILYVLGVKMHERYLFPALLFFGMAFVLHRDRRILLLLTAVTCTMFVNEGIVLDNSVRLGSQMGHLNMDTHGLSMLIALINVLCTGLAVWLSHRICVEHAEPLRDVPRMRPLMPVHQLTAWPGDPRRFRTDPSLHWRGIDWVLMLSVTIVYAAVAFFNLGSMTAPQHPWKSTNENEAVIFDLGRQYDDFTMLYFAQVSYDDFTVSVSDDGAAWSEPRWAEMAQGQCFRWKYVSNYTDNGDTRYYNSASPVHLSGRYVKLTARQIGLILNEVIFRDGSGQRIDVLSARAENANADSPLLSDPYALLDEQDTLSGEPSWYNSTYFDEIYHARTAYEHMTGGVPYETTHPPLGKVLMSWCVSLFGMTPFGWRFAGALCGVLMLPAMYLLGKQLTKRSSMAFAAMTMMALDCMHFTQTRIATIDSFPVLFILLSYLFMLRFMQRDVTAQPVKALLPDLALSGFFMGCGVASKWIGVYAGIGLALLFFWTLVRHYRLGVKSQQLIDAGETDEVLKRRAKLRLQRPIDLCLWCLLLFVLVPVIIYAASYIPYFAYTKVDGLADFIARIIRAQENMLDYHATPGLGMDHPFHSPWYEWPLIVRPMYYADSTFTPAGMNYAIFCFGNPAVWIVGLAGMAATLGMWLMRKRYAAEGLESTLHWQSASWDVAPAFVLLGLLAQFLPWVLVPRGTYIYHYFASVPFLCLGTMLLLHWMSLRYPKSGAWITGVYLILCLGGFILFYPYASGVMTPTGWLDFAGRFLRLYY